MPGTKRRRQVFGLNNGKLVAVTIEIPAGTTSIETWFRLVYETEKRFGAGEKKVEPFSMAEERSAPKGTHMAAAIWVFPGKKLMMAIFARKGATGADSVWFYFVHIERLQMSAAVKAKVGGGRSRSKGKGFPASLTYERERPMPDRYTQLTFPDMGPLPLVVNRDGGESARDGWVFLLGEMDERLVLTERLAGRQRPDFKADENPDELSGPAPWRRFISNWDTTPKG